MRRPGFFWGAVTGAALMYLLDPAFGRRRRAIARDKVRHVRREAAESAEKSGRDLGNRARGLWAELGALFRPDDAGDDVIAERVRARLGQVCSHPHAVETRVSGGSVHVRGSILGAEHARVIAALRAVRGVRAIRDELQIHAAGAGVPELQGGERRPS